MLIALASAKGAPGVTTTALALTLMWPRPVVLLDLDARGGDVMLTYGQGQDAQGRGLLGIQVASRREPWTTALWANVIALGSSDTAARRWVVPGLDRAQQAASMDWAGLARGLVGLDVDVIADCGSVRAVQAPSAVWAAADCAVMVLRPTLAGVHAALHSSEVVRSDLRATGLGVERFASVVIGPGRPYSSGDVEQALAGTAPVIGVVEWDPKAAATLMNGHGPAKRFTSTPLMRSAVAVADALQQHIAPAPTTPAAAGSAGLGAASQVQVGVGHGG